MKQQLSTPIALKDHLHLLDFIGDMTLNEYVTNVTKDYRKQLAFFFCGYLCSLTYDPKDNWIEFYVSSTNESRLEVYEHFKVWAEPEYGYELLPDELQNNLGKWRFFKLPEREKPVYLPIDNKHILEDFTDAFHEGRYVETVEWGHHVQTFVCYNCTCQISYTIDDSDFQLKVLDGNPERIKGVWEHFINVLVDMIKTNKEQGITILDHHCDNRYSFVAIPETEKE